MAASNSVIEIFTNAQRNTAYHPKGVQILKALFLKEDVVYEDFISSLKKCVHTALSQDYKEQNPYVDRIIAFTSSFCVCVHDHHLKHVDPDTESPVITSLVDFLIDMTMEKSDNHRFRSTQLLCKLFNDLVGYDLTVEFWNKVQECLLNLMEDKLAKIRVLAASALSPLQDMENTHCPINATYISHMEFDHSAQVRRVCVEHIATKRDNIPFLIETSNDIDVNVRLAVYRRAAKYPNKFKIVHKQELLKNGMCDSSVQMQKMLSDVLIPAWLQHYNFDYLMLLNGLRLDASWADLEITTKVCEFVVSTLFVSRPTDDLINVLKLNDKKLIEFNDLNYDSALYWRLFLRHLRRKNGVGIEEYEPQLSDLCEYIDEFCKFSFKKLSAGEEANISNLEFKFKLTQLFLIAKDYDYVDIYCRDTMCKLIGNILKTYSLDLETVNVIIQSLIVVIPNVLKQSKFICELTSELMYSVDGDKTIQSETPVAQAQPTPKQIEEQQNEQTKQDEEEIRKLRLKCVMLESDLEEAVRQQDFLKANELKPLLEAAKQEFKAILNPVNIPENPEPEDIPDEEQMEALERASNINDPILMKKVLTIMAGFLTSSNIKKMNAVVGSFKVNVIDEMILSTNMAVRIIAMRCLALCCTLDEHTAKMAIPTCCAIIMMHNRNAQNLPPAELVWICIGIVVDAVVFFGARLLANPNTVETNDSNDSIHASDSEHEVFTGGISLSAIIKEILEMFNDENVKLQEIACRGICNFILTSRINSLWVISRLIVKFVSPTFNDPELVKIQQYIGGTLSKLPTLPHSAIHLEKAIIPTLKIIMKAPSNSPLATVDVDHLSQMLVHICSQYENHYEIHKHLAEKLISELYDRPNNANNLIYSKILLLLNFSEEDKENNEQLLKAFDDLRDKIRESKVLSNIIKLNTKIVVLMSNKSTSSGPVASNDDENDQQESDFEE